VVEWGKEHRVLDGVCAIGIDEICVWKGYKFLRIVYQSDEGAWRLLWVGKDRKEQTLDDFRPTFRRPCVSAELASNVPMIEKRRRAHASRADTNDDDVLWLMAKPP
jgi:hypothetical protein